MSIINLNQYEDSFVIHFGTELPRINAYTLATTLVSIADAAKAANAIINPGYEIEIVVEALGPGSFKAKVKTIYRGASNLFSADSLKQIVLNIIAAYIFLQAFTPDPEVKINVATSEVVVEYADKKVIVPRNVYDSIKTLEHSSQFTKGIGQSFRAIEDDKSIHTFGISQSMSDVNPDIEVPQDHFMHLSRPIESDMIEEREIIELTDVEIIKALLERSNRKWEFVWNGIKISAPVTDELFYNDFFAHKITIAPGDALRVRLRVCQHRVQDIGVYINESYEVIEVIKHLPRAKQSNLKL